MRHYLVLVAFIVAVLAAGPAHAFSVDNGSFEQSVANNWVTSIPDYTLDPTLVFASQFRAGNFNSYEGFTATHGAAFAAVTHNGGGNQALVSSAFTLDDAAFHQLTFEYVYLTQNAPKDTTHKDPFTVTLLESGTNAVLETWTVSDVDDPALAAGAVNTFPFQDQPGMTDVYDTDWNQFRLELEDYLGKTVYLQFRINDSAQGGGVSGFFLDQLVQAPEPGTFILFGAGLLGLTVYGRRKLRRKKA